jgi:hypothetical protein
VRSETGLTVTADGSEVSNITAENVLHTQKADARLAVYAADKVLYGCGVSTATQLVVTRVERYIIKMNSAAASA